MIVYWLFFISILILIIIVLGLNLSATIETPIIYFLFWLLYIITILTIVNIVLSIYYYINVKNKRGPDGQRGPDGEQGEIGDVGKCAPNCRESLCTDGIITAIENYLTTLEPTKPIKLKNVYIKQKIKSLCESQQFNELSPYKGVDTLIKYLTEIWKLWIDLLYEQGGRIYFETIGAEMEWEWIENNPFDEIKKYDVFYWGLDKEYSPNIENKCYGINENGEKVLVPSLIKITTTNNLQKIGVLSGGNYSASLWRPANITYEGINYYPIGDIIVGPNNNNETRQENIKYGNLELNSNIESPVVKTILVGGNNIAPPVEYKLLWNNGSIWIWRPLGPSTDSNETYIALGDIATSTATPPPTGQSAPVRCVLKNALNMLKSTQQLLWNTQGTRTPMASILGFCQYNGQTLPPSPSKINAYNVFRLAPNYASSIPNSDTLASFYFIKDEYNDTNDQIGVIKGKPFSGKENQYTGKGWIKENAKDSKYSILAYLNLKPNMKIETKDKTNNRLELELVNNTTFGNSNSYIVKYLNKCIDIANNAIVMKLCNFSKASQCFRVEMTGKARGEFRLNHILTGKFLETTNGKFKLVSSSNENTLYYIK
jgi:hypothetical protein